MSERLGPAPAPDVETNIKAELLTPAREREAIAVAGDKTPSPRPATVLEVSIADFDDEIESSDDEASSHKRAFVKQTLVFCSRRTSVR